MMSEADPEQHRLNSCLKEAHKYQKQFPSVEILSSKELLEEWNDKNDAFVLVDARTAAERKVSIIRNSIPISEYSYHHADADDPATNNKKAVVVYCTIGFRSGLDATRLKQRYQDLKVYNLDGIIAFSHLVSSSSSQLLVDGVTGEPTTKIHTFASMWEQFVDPQRFQSTTFPVITLPLRFLQVGAKLVVRKCQTVGHHLGQCCGSPSSRHQTV